MPDETPNHKLNLYAQGDDDWTHTPDMETIEERLMVRDLEENRTDYTPHVDALFLATDTGTIHLGDGSSWNQIGAVNESEADFGTAENPVSSITNTHYREVTSEVSISEDYTVDFEIANVHYIMLTDDTDLQFTGDHPNLTTSCSLIIEQDDTGGHEISWPPSINWPEGSEPTLATNAGTIHRLVVENVAGTWFGMVVGEGFDSQQREGEEQRGDEVDFFERDTFDYYKDNISEWTISTAQSTQGNSSASVTSTSLTNSNISSHPGDGLPNYPGVGDTLQFYLYAQDSNEALLQMIGVPEGSQSIENGYYCRYDVGDSRISVGYFDGFDSADLNEVTSVALPTNEWVRIEFSRDWTSGEGTELELSADVYDATDTLLTSVSGTTSSSEGDPVYDDEGIGMATYDGSSSVTAYYDSLELI